MRCQAQTRAEFIHPSSDPSGSARVLCSQLISCNSLKPHACMGKMQPSVLEGNLTCQQVYWRKYQQWVVVLEGVLCKECLGLWRKHIKEFSSPGPLHTTGLSTGATRLGRNVTKVATGGGLLQPGGLGTSATLVGASQLCGSCSSSSPCQTWIGRGWPWECPAQCPLRTLRHLLSPSPGV